MRDYLGRLIPLTGTIVLSAMLFSTSSWAGRIKHPRAVFAGLDKITGRTIAFEAATGETVQFGTLQITERACFTRPATEAPQTVTFVEIDEVGTGKQFKRIFSGWMFAASPGLHGVEHPIYDIWLTDCGGEGAVEAGLEVPESLVPQENKPIAPDAAPAAPTKPSRRQRHAQPDEKTAPAKAEQTNTAPADQFDAAPEEQPEAGVESSAEVPPLGQPIEVGPPPGFIPVPRDSRKAPVQRFYPIEPDGAQGDSGDGGF